MPEAGNDRINGAARLRALLRVQLTAVHQQFIHILALRRQGDTARADRIYEIDRVDFPIVLRTLDHLVRHRYPLELAPDIPSPGWPLAQLLRSELAMEMRMGEVLATPPADPAGAQIFTATLAPRSTYYRWLEAELASADVDSAASPAASFSFVDRLFSSLITMIEQTMAHAFVYWHDDRRDLADISWATSGVAMVQATRCVNALADLHAVPVTRVVLSPHIASDAESALQHDAQLVGRLSEIAADSSQNASEPALSAISDEFAQLLRAFADWSPPQLHPAVAACAPSFRSLEATLRKFVWR